MRLTSYRFNEFQDYDKLYPLGSYGDTYGIDLAHNDFNLMIEEMKNDDVVGDEIIFSNIDIIEFESTRNTISIILVKEKCQPHKSKSLIAKNLLFPIARASMIILT